MHSWNLVHAIAAEAGRLIQLRTRQCTRSPQDSIVHWYIAP
jgi:hypothetical protein